MATRKLPVVKPQKKKKMKKNTRIVEIGSCEETAELNKGNTRIKRSFSTGEKENHVDPNLDSKLDHWNKFENMLKYMNGYTKLRGLTQSN